MDGWPYNTDEWQRTRREVRLRDGRHCFCCGREAQLDVHHIRPVRSGGAPFDLNNLASVCRSCHDWIHWELKLMGPQRRLDSSACYNAMLRVRDYRRSQLQLPLAGPASAPPPRQPVPAPARQPALAAHDRQRTQAPVSQRHHESSKPMSVLDTIGCAVMFALFVLIPAFLLFVFIVGVW